MKICRVTIMNINSLRLSTTIDLEAAPLAGAGLFAITGETGAGKTSILDAITLALYGRVHRNREVNEVMSYGAAESLAEVEFECDSHRYRAKWMLRRAHNKPDGNFQPARREVARWGSGKEEYEIIAEKVREAEQVIEEVTGLDYDRFTRSVLLAQGDFAAFLRADERDRSDLLERITGTDVYTLLSRAAYERNKLEGQRLQDLRREQESLQLMTAEQIADSRLELERCAEQIQLGRRQLDRSREELQWLRRKAELERRLARLGDARDAAEQEEQEAAPERERLERFYRLRPFESRLHRLDEQLARMQELEEDLRQKVTALADKRNAEAAAREALEEKKQILAAFRSRLTRDQPLWKEVGDMDVALREQKLPLERLRQRSEEAGQRLRQARADQEQNKTALEETGRQLGEMKDWLERNRRLDLLPEKLSGLRAQIERWQEKAEEADRLSREEADLREQLERARAGLATLEERKSNQDRRLLDLKQIFDRRSPVEYTNGRAQLLDRLLEEIEQLNGRREGLHRLVQLSGEYQRLLKELDQREEQLEHLIREEHNLYKNLLTSRELLDELEEELYFRQEMYRQQQAVANYEKDRQELQEGEPCPLCLSTHHPFRDHPARPFTDEAKAELEKARRRRDQAAEQYNRLLRRQQEISLEMEQLTGSERRRLKGRRSELLENIEHYEEKIMGLKPGLGEDYLTIGQVTLLTEKLADAERQIEQRRRTREELQDLFSQLDGEKQQLVELQQKADRQSEEVERLSQTLLEKEEKARSCRSQADAQRGSLLRTVQQFGQELDGQTPQELLDRLEKLKADWQSTQERRDRLREEFLQAEQRADGLSRQLGQRREEAAAAAGELQSAEIAWQDLHRRRRDLFGERDPQAEREALEKAIAEAETAWQQAEALLNRHLQACQSLEAVIDQGERQVQQGREQAVRLERELEADLHNAELPAPAEARAALLNPAEAERLEEHSRQRQRRRLETRKAYEVAAGELEQLLTEPGTPAPENELLNLLAAGEEQLAQLNQSAGRIRERLDTDEQRRLESAALTERIEAQTKEFRRWSRLNDVIGTADGKKFRVFAQGLTLSRLVRLANQHLRHLNGRYVIRKRSSEDLDLEIVDTFQADNCRSMNTLSGGESFLVSLALALGLSDLAGQPAHIRSLFIDEGFGSLDENSLDLAISTLENLQASGKTIGIISHVKELKERIAVQIQVKKRGHGFSSIEITG